MLDGLLDSHPRPLLLLERSKGEGEGSGLGKRQAKGSQHESRSCFASRQFIAPLLPSDFLSVFIQALHIPVPPETPLALLERTFCLISANTVLDVFILSW